VSMPEIRGMIAGGDAVTRYLQFACIATLAMAAFAQAARADSVTLLCDTHWPLDDGPMIIELNEAQSTAVVRYPSSTHGAAFERHGEEVTGPVHATFSPDTVTFSNDDDGRLDSWVVNRPSLAVALTTTDGKQVLNHNDWQCRIGNSDPNGK
jgi:hypothetical protein